MPRSYPHPCATQDSLFPLLKQLPQFLLKFIHILKFAVDGGEADVGDLVDFFEFAHDVVTDVTRCYFLAAPSPFFLERTEEFIHVFLCDGALTTRKPNATLDLCSGVRFARAIAFHDDE